MGGRGVLDVSRMVMEEEEARGVLRLASEKRLKRKDSLASVSLSCAREWEKEQEPELLIVHAPESAPEEKSALLTLLPEIAQWRRVPVATFVVETVVFRVLPSLTEEGEDEME